MGGGENRVGWDKGGDGGDVNCLDPRHEEDSLAEMTGMFTSLVDEVKDQGERNRAQLESHLNLNEEDEVMGSGDNLIDFMD